MAEYIQDELQYEGGLPYPMHVLHLLDGRGTVHEVFTEPLLRIQTYGPEYAHLVARNVITSMKGLIGDILMKNEVAVLLGVPDDELIGMAQQGKIPPAHNGRFWDAESVLVHALMT